MPARSEHSSKLPRSTNSRTASGVQKKPRSDPAQVQATRALLNFRRQPTKVNNPNKSELVWTPKVTQARTNNLQSGPIMDIFRIIDSVHDIYDRSVQQKIKAMLPTPVLTPDEKRELNGIKKELNGLKRTKGVKAIKAGLERRKKELEKKLVNKKTYPENDFVEDIFDFKQSYSGGYRSVSNNPFRATTFKSWIQQYLEMNPTSSVPTLSDMKNAWKNKFLQLAQQRNMTLFDQQMTCKALPHMNLTNSKMSRTLTGNVIKEYKLLLATDALKTSDTLSNTQLNRVTVKAGLNDIINDTTLEDNYIVNMAQVVDPATNIRTGKMYRFAFVPLTRLSNVKQHLGIESTSFSTFYELNDTNEQFTCNFKIIIELMNNSTANDPVIAELGKYIQSNSKADFLSNAKTTPQSFFTHVRVYAFPVFTTNVKMSQQLSVNGLCIQTNNFTKMYSDVAWEERINKRSYFKIHNDLTGFSVDEVIKFMQMDTPKSKDPRVIKWIIRHYLDWKRMGDSFQITHLLKLSQLNNRQFVGKRNNFVGYHPYHFVSIDILAIVQAIMFNVNFVYQMNGNAFIIGNNQAGTPMSRYIIQVLSSCKHIINKRVENQIKQDRQENAPNILMDLANGNTNMINKYNHLNRSELLRLLKECRSNKNFA
jgi:hypothetical protein